MIDDCFLGILIGGRGRRLGGRDKSALRHADGTTMLEHTVSALGPGVRDVVVAARAEQTVALAQLAVVRDVRPDAGPLSGLVALLEHAPRAWCWLVACDLPALELAVGELLARHRRPELRAVVPEVEGHVQPTCALYHRGLLDEARARLAHDELALHALLGAVPHARVPLPRELRAALRGLNTPEDLHAAGVR